jgi:membrane protein YqaA with SNARE-associated domain
MLDHLVDWLLIAGLSLAFNTTPVFAPPTLALLAFFSVHHGVHAIPAALIGGAGATLGRLLLALLSRRFGARLLPAKRRLEVEQLTQQIHESKWLNISMLAMFAVGPIPKALLFMSAGMARMPLAPGAIVFFLSRSVIYFVGLMAVGSAASSLEGVITSPVGGPLVIVGQIASIAGMFLLFRLDYRRLYQWMRGLRRRAVLDTAPTS